MPKILHFADSHIDMANYGRQDSETGLPLRVLDFLDLGADWVQLIRVR